MDAYERYLKRRRERGEPNRLLTSLKWLAVIGFFAVWAMLLVPSHRARKESIRRSLCKHNLKMIGLALHDYADEHGEFPPAYTTDENGKPLHSWRTLILPYLDQQALYDSIDLSKPWDDPANAKAMATHIEVYSCPYTGSHDNRTTYLALVGEDLCIHPTRTRRIEEMTDGLSNTVAVVEVHIEEDIPWMQPRDVDFTSFKDLMTESERPHTGGIHVLLADGSVKFLGENTPGEKTAALATIANGEEVGEF